MHLQKRRSVGFHVGTKGERGASPARLLADRVIREAALIMGGLSSTRLQPSAIQRPAGQAAWPPARRRPAASPPEQHQLEAHPFDHQSSFLSHMDGRRMAFCTFKRRSERNFGSKGKEMLVVSDAGVWETARPTCCCSVHAS